MNAERLLAHYEKIAEAPDATARLRRFIIDLAVRGKLLPQDASDEPASTLLKRIAHEKALLVKAGKIRKEKPVRAVEEDMAFDVPTAWQWTRLGVVTSYIQRGKSPKYAASEGSLVVSQKCVQWSGLDLSVAKKVTIESLADYEESRFLRDGDLLWNSTGTGTIGRVIRLADPPKRLVCDSHVTVVRCLKIDPEYIRTWLRSDHVYAQIEDRAAGSTNQVELTAQMALNQVVPLPPLAEQYRIVAKVDELLALCDLLETSRAKREAARDRLVGSSLARLNAPNPETSQTDARFVLDALPALTTRPDQIKALRQTILNLAVRGKLVPQNPKDEPASELLKRLKKSRGDLEAAGRIRKEKGDAPAHYGGEQDFELPRSWAWARLIEIGQTQTGTSPSSGNPDLFGDFIPFIKPADLDGNQINYDGPGLSEIGIEHSRLVTANSILMVCIGASLGKVNTTTRSACFNQQINSLTPFLDGLTSFISLAVKASGFQALAWSKAGTGTLPIISKGKWEQLPIPFPPLPEQHRIVAKVEELMALCDRLETSLAATAATRCRLLDALLAEALVPAKEREACGGMARRVAAIPAGGG